MLDTSPHARARSDSVGGGVGTCVVESVLLLEHLRSLSSAPVGVREYEDLQWEESDAKSRVRLGVERYPLVTYQWHVPGQWGASRGF